MAEGDRQSLSSAFDDMLKETWQELDALYTGAPTPAVRGTRPGEEPAAPQSAIPAPAPRVSPGSTEAERFLNDRYGGGWRQEILERTRDGDEVVVLGKLIIEDQDISKTQFGRARVATASQGVAGSAGGVGFSFGATEANGRATGQDAEAEAYQTAARDALAKCVAML